MVPSLFQSAEFVEKIAEVPKGTMPVGELLASRTVPVAVPSLFQNPLSAPKKRAPLTLVKSVGLEEAVPGTISATNEADGRQRSSSGSTPNRLRGVGCEAATGQVPNIRAMRFSMTNSFE